MSETTVAQIQATLEKLESEINNLQQKRSHLRNKLNDLLSATRNLPNEILSEIFRLSACEINIREPQLYSVGLESILKVGSICSRWRQVAWSAPHLWTTSLLVEEHTIPPLLISLSLFNSQSSAVSVGVDLGKQPLENIEPIFRDSQSKIGSLRVYIPLSDSTYMWNHLSTYFAAPAHWSKLKELWVCGEDWRYRAAGLLFQTSDSDALHYTRRGPDENIPWHIPMHQLTILRLYTLPIDQCMHLLLHCPSLIEFHCVLPVPSSGNYDPSILLEQPHQQKSFNLKVLRWEVFNDQWNAFFFSLMRFPNLERLHWGGPVSVDHSSLLRPDSITQLSLYDDFLPSINKLIALDWESSEYSGVHNATTLFAKTNLNFLERLFIHPSIPHSFISWLEYLTLTDEDSQNHLPNLRVFHVRIRDLEFGEWRVFGAALKFLCSRRIRPHSEGVLGSGGWNDPPYEEYWRNHTRLERFILDTDEVPLCLEQEQMDALKALAAGGLIFQLDIPNTGQSLTLG